MDYVASAEAAYELAELIWHYPRSITGAGFNASLDAIENFIEHPLNRTIFKSGEVVGDWTIPKQWEVNQAYILDPEGNRICDFKENNLHLVGYSSSFKGSLSKEELNNHLHSLPHLPNAVPYVTSYYKDYWGFCIQDSLRRTLKDGQYEVVIDSNKFDGELQIGEYFTPGKANKSEVLLSTYLCHPSMANNELSGPILAASLIKLQKNSYFKRGLRVIFLPETIGSVAYISRNLESLKSKVVGGFVLTCVGDEGQFSLLPSRQETSLSDKAARFELHRRNIPYKKIPWLERGSDERQFCAPGVDLPIASLMRTKYGDFVEYHTSMDQLGDVVTVKGITDSLRIYDEILTRMRNSFIPKSNVLGEPFLTDHNLYPSLSTPLHTKNSFSRSLLDIHSFCDGTNFIEDIADKVQLNVPDVLNGLDILKKIEVIFDV